MWGLLGQPSRSGYNYDYDDPDDVPVKRPWTWSDLLTFPLVFLLVFVVLPLTPFIALIVYCGSQALDAIKARIGNEKHKEAAQNAQAYSGRRTREEGKSDADQ